MEESWTWMKLFEDEARFYNHLLLPKQVCLWLPHYCQTWLRFTLFGVLFYFITSLLCIDFWKPYFASHGSNFISRKVMVSQIGLAMKSIPVFAVMVTGFEYMVLNGWTKCFPRITDVGFLAYVGCVILYLAVVEIGTYAIHRSMHEIKPIFKYIHSFRHQYIKETSISPFAGAAAHPLHEMLMASSHGIAILIVPSHFTTHLCIFLIEGAWSIIVHDRSQGLGWPFLSSPYHTLHHTYPHSNFGNFSIFLDYLFSTLRHPKPCVHHAKNSS